MSYGDVRAWRHGPIVDTIHRLHSWLESLLSLSDELSGAAKTPTWHGPAADAAATSLGWVVDDVEQVIASVQAVRNALSRAATRMAELAQMISDAEDLAHAHGFAIDAAGHIQVVTAPSVPSGRVGTATSAAALALALLRELKREELKVSVGKIMVLAEAIDNSLAAVLGEAERGDTAG